MCLRSAFAPYPFFQAPGATDADTPKSAQVDAGAKTGDVLGGLAGFRQSRLVHSNHRASGPCLNRCLWAAWMCRAVGHRPDTECGHRIRPL